VSGRKHGYFASEEDAKIFRARAHYALLHQIFSFNSPVWFNVGTSSPMQVSACFILSVDDTMESILTGTRGGPDLQGAPERGQLSRIIEQGTARLRRHGQRPVSFMRGADASAGTIKSAARRGARPRWSCLMSITQTSRNSSRPKAREEEKIGSCAMPGSTWTWAARTSTASSTETNNSVRVSNDSWGRRD